MQVYVRVVYTPGHHFFVRDQLKLPELHVVVCTACHKPSLVRGNTHRPYGTLMGPHSLQQSTRGNFKQLQLPGL